MKDSFFLLPLLSLSFRAFSADISTLHAAWLTRDPISSLHIRTLASKVIREGNVPSHVALIMDGNRRFARQRNLKRIEGHSMGFDKLKEVRIAALKRLNTMSSRRRTILSSFRLTLRVPCRLPFALYLSDS